MRHNLRTRKLAQIHPYTVEALQYRRELYRNDWQDAVVSQREWRYARRLEAEHLPSASDGDDEDEDSADERMDEAASSDAAPDASSPTRPARSPSLHGAASSDSDTPPRAVVPARRKRRTHPPEARPRQARGSAPPQSEDGRAPEPRGRPPTPSSDDSTDYERRFRILKRMMPAHMARACIDDLRAMRHGHADDSDASSSSSSSPASPPRAASVRASSPASPLRPGESRRRTGAPIDAHAPLLSDVDSASDSAPPTPSPPLEDGDVRWWCEPRRAASPPVREADAVDRMLTRTSGARGFGQRNARGRRRDAQARRAPPKEDGAWMWRVQASSAPARTPQGAAPGAPGGTLRAVAAPSARRRAPRAASPSESDASDDERPTGTARRPRRVAPIFLVPGDAERVRGIPTTRGDVQSYARLPYVQGASRAASIDASNHAALVDVPMPVPSMKPKRVPRRGAADEKAAPAAPAVDAAALEKQLAKQVGALVVKQLSKHKHELDRERFKRHAKELTRTLCSKEMRNPKTWPPRTGHVELGDEKRRKMKMFAHDYIKKLVQHHAKRARSVSTNPDDSSRGTDATPGDASMDASFADTTMDVSLTDTTWDTSAADVSLASAPQDAAAASPDVFAESDGSP